MTGNQATFGQRILAFLPPVLVLGLLLAAGCGDEKSDFTFEPRPEDPAPNWFFGIWGLDENNIFVVGQPGLIYYFNGNEWRREVSGTTVALTDVWGDGTGAIYATGHQGVILRRMAGGIWTSMDSGTSRNLHAIGAFKGTVMAAGLKGTLRKLVGQSWVKAPEMIFRYGDADVIEDTLVLSKDIESLTAVAHHAVTGSEGIILMEDQLADWQLRTVPDQEWVICAAGNTERISGNFIATDRGRLYQLNRNEQNQLAWGERYSPALESIVYGIYVDAGDTVWAVTNDGRINRVAPPHFGIDSFTRLFHDDSLVFFDIWGTNATNIYAVGTHGCVLRYHEVDGEYGWHQEELPDLPESKSFTSPVFDKFGRLVHR